MADPNIVPDLNDPNGYCKSCKINYKSLEIYKQRLRKIHQMTKNPMPTPHPKITPEIGDATHTYCASCDYVCVDRTTYLLHLKNKHDIKFGKEEQQINPNAKPD